MAIEIGYRLIEVILGAHVAKTHRAGGDGGRGRRSRAARRVGGRGRRRGNGRVGKCRWNGRLRPAQGGRRRVYIPYVPSYAVVVPDGPAHPPITVLCGNRRLVESTG